MIRLTWLFDRNLGHGKSHEMSRGKPRRNSLSLERLEGRTMLSVTPPHLEAGLREVTVMSQNLYLGADLIPVLEAVASGDPNAIVGATSLAWQQVQATNFPERAEAIAAQIEANGPILIGLQEVSLFRTGDFGDPSPAEDVVLDYLEILIAALDARGLDYEVVAVTTNDDFEAPAFTSVGVLQDIRLTDRDVILARADLPPGKLKLSNVQEENFVTNAVVPGVPLLDGWNSVDVRIRGKEFRFINTHLDSLSALVRTGQAQELLAGPANTELPVLMVGDFNSPADVPGSPAYELLIEAGFQDVWNQTHPSEPGYTWGNDADLLNDEPLALDQRRIDLVLFRGDFQTVHMNLLGDEPGDRTSPSMLWPSDHLGVVATVGIHARPHTWRFPPIVIQLPHVRPLKAFKWHVDHCDVWTSLMDRLDKPRTADEGGHWLSAVDHVFTTITDHLGLLDANRRRQTERIWFRVQSSALPARAVLTLPEHDNRRSCYGSAGAWLAKPCVAVG